VAVVTEKQLAQGRAQNTFSTFYTVPAGTVTTVLTIDICNTTAADHALRICFVPASGSADESTALFWDVTIDAKSPAVWTGPQTLKNVGSTIQVMADVSDAITLTISGIEKVP
jgi:hypothetical protein